MAKRVLSIEIGLQTTKVCEIEFGKKTPKVYKAFIFDTPEDTIEDGYIRNKVAFAAALQEQLKAEGIKEKNVVYTIASTKIANREVTIPLVKDKRIQAVIDASAQDYFPVDVSEYTISYQILKRIEKGEEKGIHLLLLAAPDNLIKNYYSFSQEMGFHIVAMDYVGNSALQILKHQIGTGVNMTVQMNEQTTLINIIKEEELILQRTILFGTMSAIETMQENPAYQDKNEKELHQVLMEEEILYPALDYEEEAAATLAFGADKTPEERNRRFVRREVTETFSYLISNITRVIDYFHSKYPDLSIETVLITGHGSRIENIAELFQHELDIQSQRITTLENVGFPKKLLDTGIEQSEFISVIGATISPIGFYSKEAVNKESKKSTLSSTYMIFALAVVSGIALVVVSNLGYKTALLDNESFKNKITQLEAVNDIYSQNVAVTDEYNSLNEIYIRTETYNRELTNLLKELEVKLPTDTWVESFVTEGANITFNMRSLTKPHVGRLLMNLKRIPLIDNLFIPSISESNDEESGSVDYTFSLNCIYTGETSNETTE